MAPQRDQDSARRAATRATGLAAAGSLAVRELLVGPPASAEIIGALRHAVLLSVPSDPGDRVLAVVAADAALVANAVRLAVPGADMPFERLRPGARAVVGERAVRFPDGGPGALLVRVGRWWDSAVPTVRPDPAAVRLAVARVVRTPGGLPADALRAIGRVDPGVDAAGWTAAALAIVGLGPGLTPSGDDVIAGALVGLHATGRGALARRIGAALDGRLGDRTTAFSADLVRLAARGHAAGEMIRLVRALHSTGPGRPAEPDRALAGLLRVGHTSGADLATGLFLTLAAAVPMAANVSAEGRR